MYLPNGVEFVQILYAAFLAGAIVVPVNTRHTPRELAYFVRECRARALVLHADDAAAVDAQADGLQEVRHIVVGGAPDTVDSFETLGRLAAAQLPAWRCRPTTR